MKRLLPLFLLCGSMAFGAQSLASGSAFISALPNTTPYTNVGNWRIEFRIHGGWSYAGGVQQFYATNDYNVRIFSGSINLTSFRDGGGGSAQISIIPTAGTDVIVRFQRTTTLLTAETFTAATGTGLSNTGSPGTAGSPNDGGSFLAVSALAGGDTAFIRTFTTTVPIGTPPSNVTCDGTEVDYEFEGNGTNCGPGTGANLPLTGDTYVATPVYNPVSSFNGYPMLNNFRVGGGSQQLTSSSFSSTDNATLSYFWQQLAGPSTGSFSSRTSTNPTFSASLAGSYTVELSVRDSTGATATPATSLIGGLATDSNYVATTGLNPILDNLLGSLLLANGTANPWPFGDLGELGTSPNMTADAIAGVPVRGAALSGTVSWGAPPTQTFTTTSNLISALAGQTYVLFAWNSVDGSGTGNAVCPIQSVTSATITCNINMFMPSQSGVTAYLVPGVDANGCVPYLCWANGQPNIVWNYYDNGIALYREYYRSGNSSFLTAARAYADINWAWMIDHGYGSVYPRAASMDSQYYRALEAHPERFPYLYNETQSLFTSFGNPTFCPNCDNREAGYAFRDVADGAKTDPDPTRHAGYCTILTTYAPVWISKQASDGSFPENEFALNPTFVSAPKAFVQPVQYGAAPWRSINLPAFEGAHEVLASTDPTYGCNQPTIAANLLVTIQNLAAWTWNYGRDSNVASAGYRGEFYEVNYQSADQSTVVGSGTVSINTTSTALVGVGTNWLTAGYCDGTHFIGFQAPRTIYKIVSCADNTHAVITPPYNFYSEGANLVASTWSVAPAASTGCGSLATYCFGPVGDRNLTRTLGGAYAWLYHTTSNAMYLSWANENYSATLGGPSAGINSNANIGAFVTPCGGPGCDGLVGDVVTSAAACGSAPCVPGGNAYGNLGKNFGEAFGVPAIDNVLGWRVGGVQPPSTRVFYIGYVAPAGCISCNAAFTYTLPDGTAATTNCSSSPCSITMDTREGNTVLSVLYTGTGFSAPGAPYTIFIPPTPPTHQTGNIVALGDSLTQGYYYSLADPYPYKLGRLLNLSPVNTHDLGIAGYRTDQVQSLELPTALTLYNAALGTNTAIYWAGINDCLQSIPLATVESQITSTIASLNGIGYRTMIFTLTPENSATQPAGCPAFETALNAFINGGGTGASIVVNINTLTNLQNTSDLTYFYPDKLHINDPGYIDITNAAFAVVP